jgi:hypothetical protein
MPVISTFFGIVIRMFYKEHEPQHFHAEQAGQHAKFDFAGNVVAGQIRSRKARERIRNWAQLHQVELEANWAKMKAGRPLEHPAVVGGTVMTFLPSVVHAEHRGDFRLRVVFNDGSENVIDFTDWLAGEVFEPLKDLGLFKRFFVDGGTVVWPNGADVAPETLYDVPGRRRPTRRVQPAKARRRKTAPRRSGTRLRG